MRNLIVPFFLLLLISCGSLRGEPAPFFPPRLKKGDTIAVIAPASSPEEDPQTVARTIKKIIEKGYRVKTSPNLMTRYGYLAGTDYERAKAFMDAWLDPDVKAVWCWRGGYGCARILDRLDYRAIKDNPKIFIGMSDVTALHAAIIKETGLVTFLGPNVNAVYGKDEQADSLYNEKELWRMISGGDFNSVKNRTFTNPKTYPAQGESVLTVRSGICRGRLTGGTLSLVASLVGTPWQLDTKGKIVVLEEVDEEPYRIDRMLCQLKLAGQLDQPAGVVLCSWKACKGRRPDRTLSLEHIFREYFEKAPYPVLLGFPSGHITDQATLPLNAMAELDAGKRTLRLLEEPVEARE
jgi:muramoyltetrapeptide carboxypeptidase